MMTRLPDRRGMPSLPPRAATAARLLAAFAATAVLAITTGCSRPEPPQPPPIPGASIEGVTITFPPDSPQLKTLRTVEALTERAGFVRVNGRATWDESRTTRVLSPVAGRIVELAASPGQTVARGALLAVLSSPEFGQAQAEARRAESDLAQAERALGRARELHGAGVLPLKEVQQAEAEHARQLAERDRTAARERAYGASRRIDQQFRLVSPLGGVVVERRANVGLEVRNDAGPDVALFLISDPSRLWIVLDVPEALVTEIQVGEAVRVLVPALPGELFSARVEYVADFVDPQTRMVRARAAVDNTERKLKAEMYVNAEVEVPASTALKVPNGAVFLQGTKYHAFVEETPGRFVRRELRAEDASLGQMRVIKGLAAGERVVVDGALLLQQLLQQKATAPAGR